MEDWFIEICFFPIPFPITGISAAQSQYKRSDPAFKYHLSHLSLSNLRALRTRIHRHGYDDSRSQMPGLSLEIGAEKVVNSTKCNYPAYYKPPTPISLFHANTYHHCFIVSSEMIFSSATSTTTSTAPQ